MESAKERERRRDERKALRFRLSWWWPMAKRSSSVSWKPRWSSMRRERFAWPPRPKPIDLAQIMEKGRYDNVVGRERQRRGLHDPIDLQAVLSQPAFLLVMPSARLHEIAGRFHEGNDPLHPGAAGLEEDFSNLIFSGHRRNGWFEDKDTNKYASRRRNIWNLQNESYISQSNNNTIN